MEVAHTLFSSGFVHVQCHVQKMHFMRLKSSLATFVSEPARTIIIRDFLHWKNALDHLLSHKF